MRIPVGYAPPVDVVVDHTDKWVEIYITNESEGLVYHATMAPVEAKCLAAALVHYAERVQTIRDRGDV